MIPKQPESRGARQDIQEARRDDAYRDTDRPVRVITANQLGIPRARNLGAEQARGEYVLFLDAHCTVSPTWIDRFIAALGPRDVAIAGPTFTRLKEPEPKGCGNLWMNHRLESAWLEPVQTNRPYEVPITPGGCQAFRRSTFLSIGGFDSGFTRWGYQDEEICLRAWLHGYRVVVDPRSSWPTTSATRRATKWTTRMFSTTSCA